MSESDLVPAELSKLLGLFVHDLRNPAATLGANIDFLREVGVEDPDAKEAVDDMVLALEDLKRGLTQLAWIARWIGGQPAVALEPGDLCRLLPPLMGGQPGIEATLDLGGLASAPVPGAPAVAKMVELLLANAKHHLRRGVASVTLRQAEGGLVLEFVDGGVAIAEELRGDVFTLGGQGRVKSRPDGRYGRFAGLLALRVLADAIGARLEATGQDGAATVRIHLAGG
ncbi:MAG: hypothetical protein OEY14_02125 [Myxococcales bacterium]|nr:hypothetical protein [Myxococcales bacterium]